MGAFDYESGGEIIGNEDIIEFSSNIPPPTKGKQ